MWDTQYTTTCPTGDTTSNIAGRKLLAGRHLMAPIALPTSAAALGTRIASSDFEAATDSVFSSRLDRTNGARAAFNLYYNLNTVNVYSGTHSAQATVKGTGVNTQPWDIQITSNNLNMQAGKAYQVSRHGVRMDYIPRVAIPSTSLAAVPAAASKCAVLGGFPRDSSSTNLMFLPGRIPTCCGVSQALSGGVL